MGKWLTRILGAGVLAGALYALWRALDERARTSTIEWTPQPFPSPPMPVPHTPDAGDERAAGADASSSDAAWVEPDDGRCPVSHPVKAKLGSGIFHVPGGQMYDRAAPDRCYRDAASAAADGLRASKR